MELLPWIVRTKSRIPFSGNHFKPCKDVGEVIDVGIPAMLRRSTIGIEVLQRVEADSVNTWDVYTIIGEGHFGSGGTALITCECREGLAFEKVKEFGDMGPDVHVYAYRHIRFPAYGIDEMGNPC
jgi:hypothetical protein